MAKQDSNSYYAQYTTLPQDEAVAFARNVWKTVNLENLEKFIEPTRNRAELILHKAADHKIDEIYLKK